MQELIKLIPTGTFASHLAEIKKHRPKLFIYKIASSLPWERYQQDLTDAILKAINRLGETAAIDPDLSIPETGLAGVYFCIGEDGRTFTVGGSLYFNEEDWAANAQFYPDCQEAESLMFEITNEIIESLELKWWKIDYMAIAKLMYVFAAFTIFHTMNKIENKPELIHCGMAMGYSDGGELTLGKFKNGKFKQALMIVEDIG